MNETKGLVARAQFGQMLWWSARGWRPRPAGHRCRHCGGPLWGKVEGQWELFKCTACGIGSQVKVK